MFAKNKYKEELKSSVKKRKYKRQLSYDEYHDKIVKNISKEIHSFLKNNSTMIPKGSKASNHELNLIMKFMSLTKLHEFEEIQEVRNWIFR